MKLIVQHEPKHKGLHVCSAEIYTSHKRDYLYIDHKDYLNRKGGDVD